MAEAPWDRIRWVAHQAPYWAVRVEGLGRAGGADGRGEPPRCLITLARASHGGELSQLQSRYFDLKRAIAELGQRHTEGAKLQLIVEMRLQGETLEAIAKALPGRLSSSGVRHALDRAYFWICHPAHGRFLSWEEWERGADGS